MTTLKQTARDRALEHLRKHPAQTFEKLTLATLIKEFTLRKALKELLDEGKIRRRRYRGKDFYFIREDHTA